jgi:SAM-dependent methyltransferase
MKNLFFPTTNKKLRQAVTDPIEMTYIQRETLKEKPQFLEWYQMVYRYIAEHRSSGERNIEIGSGSSFLSEFIPGLIKSNILHIRFNDLTFDAYRMPFRDRSIDNIILIDVFHHFDQPIEFFKEANRVLKSGGRILISDPYISFFSYLIWKYIHPENCDMKRLGYDAPGNHNPLLYANSASLTLLFERDAKHFGQRFPALKVATKDYHTVMHYWLAGGYNFPSFIPLKAVKIVMRLEKALAPLSRWLASFIFVVIEKKE